MRAEHLDIPAGHRDHTAWLLAMKELHKLNNYKVPLAECRNAAPTCVAPYPHCRLMSPAKTGIPQQRLLQRLLDFDNEQTTWFPTHMNVSSTVRRRRGTSWCVSSTAVASSTTCCTWDSTTAARPAVRSARYIEERPAGAAVVPPSAFPIWLRPSCPRHAWARPTKTCTRAGLGTDESHREFAGADDFLPVLIYVLIHANPPQLASNLMYIERFRMHSRMMSESAYFFTQLVRAWPEVQAIA